MSIKKVLLRKDISIGSNVSRDADDLGFYKIYQIYKRMKKLIIVGGGGMGRSVYCIAKRLR